VAVAESRYRSREGVKGGGDSYLARLQAAWGVLWSLGGSELAYSLEARMVALEGGQANIETEIGLALSELENAASVSQYTELNRNLYERLRNDIRERGHADMFNAFVEELKRRRLRPLERGRVAKKLADHFIDIGHVDYATPEDVKRWVELKSASGLDRAYDALLHAAWRLGFLGIQLTFMDRRGVVKSKRGIE
jgi:hypothetical protein